MNDSLACIHCNGDFSSQLINCYRRLAPDIEYSRLRLGNLNCSGDNRSNITNVTKRPDLLTVTKDRHRLTAHDLVHEYPDHVPVRVANVLSLPVYIMRTEYCVIEAEHRVSDRQFSFHRCLSDPIRILRLGTHCFSVRHLLTTIDSHR